MASYRLVPPQACRASTNCSSRSTSPVNSALPLMLSLNCTTSALSTSSSLCTKVMAASCRKCMLLRMLPLASSTSTTESGIFVRRGPRPPGSRRPPAARRPRAPRCPSGPGRGTNRPALSCTTAVTETTSTSTSSVKGGGVGSAALGAGGAGRARPGAASSASARGPRGEAPHAAGSGPGGGAGGAGARRTTQAARIATRAAASDGKHDGQHEQRRSASSVLEQAQERVGQAARERGGRRAQRRLGGVGHEGGRRAHRHARAPARSAGRRPARAPRRPAASPPPAAARWRARRGRGRPRGSCRPAISMTVATPNRISARLLSHELERGARARSGPPRARPPSQQQRQPGAQAGAGGEADPQRQGRHDLRPGHRSMTSRLGRRAVSRAGLGAWTARGGRSPRCFMRLRRRKPENSMRPRSCLTCTKVGESASSSQGAVATVTSFQAGSSALPTLTW